MPSAGLRWTESNVTADPPAGQRQLVFPGMDPGFGADSGRGSQDLAQVPESVPENEVPRAQLRLFPDGSRRKPGDPTFDRKLYMRDRTYARRMTPEVLDEAWDEPAPGDPW